MLRKSPGFTAIALITLAIGIGANTIMFSIPDAMLLVHPGGVKDPERLAYCGIQGVEGSSFRHSEYLAIRDSGLAFSDVLAQSVLSERVTLVREGSAWSAWAAYVSSNFLSVLGTTPVLGRGFSPEEERQGSAPVAVLSYRCWRRLGGDPKLVGEFVGVGGTTCQIIGVAPEGFNGVTFDGCDLWLPLESLRTVHRIYRTRADLEPSFHVVGRLRPEVIMAVAQARLQALVPRFKQESPADWANRSSIYLRPPGWERINSDIKQDRLYYGAICLALVMPVAILLVIACLNLANMLIVQGASRHREIAIRMALGGGRWRVVRQLLIESGLLATLGGGLGVLLAFAGVRVLRAYIAAFQDEATILPFGLSVRVLAATVGVCAMATLLFGLRPALALSKRDIAGEMKAAGGSVLGSFQRKRGRLSVAGQVALAVALVLCATLLMRSALEAGTPDPRFPLADKLVVEINPLASGYDEVRSVQAYEALADHLASLPEVKAVGASGQVFFGGGGWIWVTEYLSGAEENESGEPLARKVAFTSVGRDYFKAMEIPLLQGRLFDRLDGVPDAEKVAIIDESLARKLRPDGDALGCIIRYGVFAKADSDSYRVVGIVANLPGIEKRDVHAQVYAPIGMNSWAACLYLHVADGTSTEVLQQRIFKEIRRFDPQMPVLSVATLAQRRCDDSAVWLARFAARLAAAVGTAALFLAALGIYAIKGYMVASRTSEIGIRKALGATHGSILGMVLREGLLVTAAGLIVGLLLGLAVAKVAASLFYGISPIDPVSIVVTVVLLGAASLLASYLPARRAARVDPMVALRCE
jgi:predicted permease